MKSYKENIDEIIEKTGLEKNEFFDFEYSPNQLEYLNFYNFYSETLELNSDYGIAPSYLFYKNGLSMNAWASVNDGVSLIGINMGTLNWLFENFKLNTTLVKDNDIFLFDKLTDYTDIPINELMFQAGCHFTFYHELAHLIQKSEYLALNLEEDPSVMDEFDIGKHLVEIDADTFSALSLGVHTMMYCDNTFGEDASKPLIESMLILFSIPIILYLLSFAGNKDELYFRENTHPHPSIRLTNVLLVLTQYCNNVLEAKGRDFSIDHFDIFINAMDISKKLEQHFFGSNVVSNYKEMITQNKKEIIEYMGQLIADNEINHSSATNKWNLRNSS